MIRTVDLVVTGDVETVLAAVADALRCGDRVLVVLQSGDPQQARRVRRHAGRLVNAGDCRLTVMTNAEVVCVDGVDRVESVVIREVRTGRLSAVNASAFQRAGGD